MVEARLLQQRRATKLKKPRFLRQDATRNKSLKKTWRKAKGMHSKMRMHLKEVHVQNSKDLQGFDPKTQIIVFGRIGLRNKMSLLKICAEKKYPVSQIKDVSAFMQKVEADFTTRKNRQN